MPSNPRRAQDAGAADRLKTRIAALRESDVGKAGGLAVAMIAFNLIALVATVVFARLLDDYGSLAALISYFLILSVGGLAMQVATARETVLGTLGHGPDLLVTLRGWTRTLLLAMAAVTVVSVLLRQPIAALVGIDQEWGAALGLPAGMLWLLLAIYRGALQGVGDYRAVGVSLVGEQTARLIAGAALAVAGLDVTGAFLGTPLAFVVTALWCWRELQYRLPGEPTSSAPALRLRDHVVGAWAPIAGLVVIAVLQNVDVIAAKHAFSTDVASSYGATAVAAKVLVWIAMGAGFYLVPETTRRNAEGEDTRPVLLNALAIVLVCAVPVLLIFALAPRLLLRLAFGPERLLAVDALLPLGVAFTLLAVTYLAIQYQLALRRTRFLIPLALVAAAEPALLLTSGPSDPEGFAALLLAIQAVAAGLALALAFTRGRSATRQPARQPSEAGGSTRRD